MSSKTVPGATSFADTRRNRAENVVLVADDDAYMRALVKAAVRGRGKVEEATDGKNITALYRQCAPDILFLDVHMPVKNGIDTLQEILTEDPGAFVIMISADGATQNVEYMIRLGASGFLVKPFSKDRVLQYLEQCPTMRR